MAMRVEYTNAEVLPCDNTPCANKVILGYYAVDVEVAPLYYREASADIFLLKFKTSSSKEEFSFIMTIIL